MNGGPAPRLTPHQHTALVPKQALLQFTSLLPLPAIELDGLIQEAIDTNPALHRRPGGPCAGCGRHCKHTYCSDCRLGRLPTELSTATDWREDLAAATRLELPASAHDLVELIIGSLDERGFLTDVPEPRSRTEEAARALVLAAIRRVGPPGIACTSATECIRLQVGELIEAGGCSALLGIMVTDHLSALAEGDLAAIAAATGATITEVEAAAATLRARVRPYPLTGGAEPRVAPDVFFSLDPAAPHGALRVQVADARWFGVELDPSLGLLGSRAARAWLRGHRREAVALLAALEARSTMLTRIALRLAQDQREFLLHRAAARPMSRQTLAQQLGVHPSTVGRAIQGKSARCPDGRPIALADCFGSDPRPKDAVLQALAEHPGMSDAAVSGLLEQQGVRVARRTVAKYRAALRAQQVGAAKQPSPE